MFDPVASTHQTAYFSAMAKSLQEKLFFLPSLENVDTVLDFGCADGHILEALATLRPDLTLIGYDLDTQALALAKERAPTAFLTNTLTPSLLKGRRVAMVVSSVFHEVCSYGGETAETAFWQLLDTAEITQLAWRDMTLRESAKRAYDGYAIAAHCETWQIASFEDRWGRLDSLDRILHFLLKEPWKTNWAREVNENYFPRSASQIMENISQRFSTLNVLHHIPPVISAGWAKRFGFVSPEPTHLRITATR